TTAIRQINRRYRQHRTKPYPCSTTIKKPGHGDPVLFDPDRLDAFEDRGDTLAETDAHGRHTQGAAVLLHHVQQGAGDTGTGAAVRVTQRDGTTVQVDLLVHLVQQLQVLQHRQGLGGEGFVQLDVIDVVHGQAGTLEGLLGGRHRAVAHDRRVDTGHGHGADHGHRLD